tara:strand:+ start:6830 stop:8050 length:1221 start_codon:yes stop_codon:yes gene_type:complete
MAKIIETKFPDLHEAQLKVAQSDARWKILCAGRRFGKTRLGVQMCLETALAGKRAWWVAPTYTIARVGWRDIQEAARSFPPEYEPTISLVNMEVTFPWCGGSIAVRSADSPHRLRGEGLDFLVMDEAAFTKPDVWHQVLRPTLTERKGGALFISTPMGMNNWFYELWEFADDKEDWEKFQFATYDNPAIDKDEVQQAKGEVGSIVFAQEYLAEFVEAGQGMLQPDWLRYFKEKGGVFFAQGENVSLRDCSRFCTVDLATSIQEGADYTVIASFAITPKGKVLVLDVVRERMEAPDIIPRIRQKMAQYDLQWVGMERAGFQLALIQFAKRDGLPVKELKADKDKVSRAMPLAARMEAGDIFLRQGAPWLVEVERELMSFPVGQHDDIVDALGYGVLSAQAKREWMAY